MTDYLPVLLGVIGLTLIVACFLIIKIGDYIGTMETPKSGGISKYSKPEYSSKITSVLIMIMFICGSIVLLSHPPVILLTLGIAIIIFAGLIAFTTLIFMGAVINSINSK
jgi:hypothetical protein